MAVEEIRGNMSGERENYDDFPVGMRVLAVDDDPICLKVLDGLLRKCQYHVTTTSQARTALQMLRENRDRFDLVIIDVHMPDMDGFKLLELVNLETDLPVIMLSANSDSKLVMKAITHGACDYLVKPVRLEELKNIWQHVIRENFDDFPVGMRVLAVDDDPVCLKILDGLLRKCQYHVTTTSQARTALQMLRENRDRFDLVIIDVHMPDIDGFKLLDLVTLETDLPVIMLSANSDSKLVMKAITHGACDYLVKPVRLEELKIIGRWRR